MHSCWPCAWPRAALRKAGRTSASAERPLLSRLSPHPPTFRCIPTRPWRHWCSYRFMLTPSSALEANYGITYENKIHYYVNPNNYQVNTRTQEISARLRAQLHLPEVQSVCRSRPGRIDLSAHSQLRHDALDVKQQTAVGGLYGGGIAYEISPSFDIRAEYRGLVTKVPTFGNSPVRRRTSGTTSTIRRSAWRTTSRSRVRE